MTLQEESNFEEQKHLVEDWRMKINIQKINP